MRIKKLSMFNLLVIFASVMIAGLSSCGGDGGGGNSDGTSSANDPTLRTAEYISTLTAAEGTVVFEGLDPANAANGTIRRYTFNADGTLSLYWNANNMGWMTSTGTWSYDANNVLTIAHTGGTTMVITMTEVYDDSGIVYDNGNKLSFATRKLTTPFANTIVGTYDFNQTVEVLIPVISMHMDVVVDGNFNVTDGNPLSWTYHQVSVQTGPDKTITEDTNGTLAVPGDVWLYQIGSEYFIQTDFTYEMTRQ